MLLQRIRACIDDYAYYMVAFATEEQKETAIPIMRGHVLGRSLYSVADEYTILSLLALRAKVSLPVSSSGAGDRRA